MTRPAGPGDPSSAASFLGGCYPPLCLSLRVHGSALLGPLLTWCCFGGYYPGLSRLPVPFPVVLRFYEPPISTEEQVRPLRVFMRVSTGGFSFFHAVSFVRILILCLSPKLESPTSRAG